MSKPKPTVEDFFNCVIFRPNLLTFILCLVTGVSNGLGPPENPTREVLDRSEDIWVGFRVLFSGHFRVRVGIGSGIGSYKNNSLNPIFLLKKTLLSLSSPPSALRLCVSRIYYFVYKL